MLNILKRCRPDTPQEKPMFFRRLPTRIGLQLACLMVGLVAGLFVWGNLQTPALFAQTATDTIIDDPAELDPGEVVRVENGGLRQVAFSPDESFLVAATRAGLWVYAPGDAGNGELLNEEPVAALWWSPDSTLLAAALDDGTLQLWQMEERELVGVVDGAGSDIVSVAWSPDGSQIATGSADGMIEIWSVTEGLVLETLEGHSGRIVTLYWIAAGSQIVSAADDGSVRVWGVEVAAPVAPAATPAPTPVPATATVGVDRLNVRSGPGTDFERIATGLRGEALAVLDQEDDCAWLQVRIPDGAEGWVAGGPQFVSLDVPCAEVGRVVEAPSPTPQPTPRPILPLPTSTPASQDSQAAPTPTSAPVDSPPPTATATSTPAVASPSAPAEESTTPDDPFPPEQGCYLFQNGLPVALSIIFTRPDDGSSQTIELAENEEAPFCFDPGAYSYVIRYQVSPDATPAEIPGEITVNAGDRFMFPIRAQE
jgi:hypothetical protein